MAKVHLIERPVGAGKSTFAAQLGQRKGCSAIALDD
ncbi:MAG: adenylate kinase family enzyme [Paracoccaceae bacterium]|jgi:adenylate kinase family enzyme